MRENNLIIICLTVILCLLIVAGTFIIINSNNADSNNPGIIDNVINSVNPSDNSANENTAKGSTSSGESNPLEKINWATFYADGNPNTGEEVTVNVGSQHAGKTVSLSMNYYRDGNTLIEEPAKTYVVNGEGNVYIPDTTSMARYPDKCTITVTCEGHSTTATCNLEKRKGSQTIYFD
ncbi:MAG: hypothetical protein Q4Q22_05640 [Methanosphaera sp.]|nr:hypothetical protein [Methanosphaera sp.]